MQKLLNARGSSRWRVYVQARFTAGCGGFDGEGSAWLRGRRLGVERREPSPCCGEARSGASPAVNYGIRETMPT